MTACPEEAVVLWDLVLVWNLAFEALSGIWYLVFGIWYLAFGIWYLVFGIWYLPALAGKYLVSILQPHFMSFDAIHSIRTTLFNSLF